VDRKKARTILLNCESQELNSRPLLSYHVKFHAPTLEAEVQNDGKKVDNPDIP
jgi:hypothetical protein